MFHLLLELREALVFNMSSIMLNEVLNSDHLAIKEQIALKSAINVLGTAGEAPLHISIYKRDMHMMKMLLDAGANIMFRNDNGDTSLHVAARMGLSQVVELLYTFR